ncbi:gamma carbonic anhydrase family protein [Chloroflexota bacterium]
MIRSFDCKTPQIAETAFVSETAYVIGEVEIGEHSGIWPGAVLRGDSGRIKLGDNVDVEDNSVLHGEMDIGSNVVIGHGVVMHGRRIGNNVIIGSNATILFDAEIEDNCVVAAGAVVTDGTSIPAGSFATGIPAKVKSEVSGGQKALLQRHLDYYPALLRKYLEEGL